MKKIIVFLLCLTVSANFLFAQDIERNVKERLTDYFNKYTATAKISTPKLNSFDINYDRKTIAIYASESFAYQPFRPETVENIYNQVKELLPGPVHYYQLTIYADGKPIEDLVPNFYRNKKKDKERLSLNIDYKGAPWVKNISRPNEISRGLQNRHIAIWQSHGNYFKNDKNEWGWQRPRLFCTTEDMFTQSFVLPYVIPMLENAGAIVYTPRERDTQKNEIIVDNDTPNASLYLEVGSKKANWTNAPVRGFAQKKTIYKEGENPFTDGTCRFIPTERKKKKNKDQVFAEWVPTLPATGKYAVYVSYQTLPNSVSDAKYLVFHNGGVTEFKVNQKIGGGTWVYPELLNSIKGTTTTAWWYLATRAANMELYAPMQYVLEVEWETLPVEEEPAGCPVTWKEHATLRNGRECHTKYMQDAKVKTTIQTTSTHVPTLSTICRAVLSTTRNNRV